ncbi:hypothetical protein ACJ73_01521 [Blastomyces percursus]|uniref:Protein-lysine N-methyltransferase EFM4 n=1 Tax=Blastomyces percursus TaxID=1658174 RepID=A0A1J9QEZ8_9EURO|nr:hypothetical protein ACJ73_01521 [Blastomyces percursus]
MSTLTHVEGIDGHPPHLEPSQLGTKEYWESFYDNSLSHLSSKARARKGQKRTKDENEAHVRNDEKGKGEDDDNGSDEDEDEDDDGDDPGTSWFTEHSAPEKVMSFLTSESFPLAPCNTSTSTQTQSQSQPQPQPQPNILDLGTGNGSMLALLRDEGGFTGGQMVGVDYSPKSIELARRLHHLDSSSMRDDLADTTTTSGGSGTPAIRFEVWDVFDKRVVEELDWFPADQGGFDIVLDKGTFDAISLSAAEVVVDVGAAAGEGGAEGGEKEEENVDTKRSRVVQRRVCERYPGIVRGLVRKDGFLVVTSCNWTEEELIRWFTRRELGEGEGDGGDRLVVWGRVEYPKFRFGGQEGQGVCTVCFRRVSGS